MDYSSSRSLHSRVGSHSPESLEKSGANSTDSLSAPREQVTSIPSHSGLPDKEGAGVMEPPLEKTEGQVIFTKDLLAPMTD